jgi:hypothetical protein
MVPLTPRFRPATVQKISQIMLTNTARTLRAPPLLNRMVKAVRSAKIGPRVLRLPGNSAATEPIGI